MRNFENLIHGIVLKKPNGIRYFANYKISKFRIPHTAKYSLLSHIPHLYNVIVNSRRPNDALSEI